MINIKSLFALMAFASFLLALGCAIPFGIDLWNNIHTASFGGALSAALKYRGAGGMLAGIVMFVLFLLLYRVRRD